MSKLLQKTKVLLVAAGLFVGASAWATITTRTYDFTTMGTYDKFTKGDALGGVYGQKGDGKCHIPSEIATATDNNLALWDRNWTDGTWRISPTGLYNSNSSTGGIYLGGLQAGDHVTYTFSGDAGNLQAAATGDAKNSTTITAEGPLLAYWGSLTSGNTYYATSTYISVVVKADVTVTSITVVSNSSENYATLFNLWRNSVSVYNNEANTEGREAYKTAIDAAKSVIDASEVPVDDYVAAIAALREADDLFLAANGNDTYRVNANCVTTDGHVVKSVAGITMTYRGSWTWTTERSGKVYASTIPTRTNNLPTSGDYWEFNPTVDGNLQLQASWYADQYYYLVDAANGNIVTNIRQAHSGNEYEAYYDFGDIKGGHTYYFYRISDTNGYQFGGFIFTPGEYARRSYTASSGEIVKGGSVIESVAGITMTYGGSSDVTWLWNADDRKGYKAGSRASVTSNVPTAGTFVIFEPTMNGKLTVKWYGYANNRVLNANLSDGTNVEQVEENKTGNGDKTAVFNTYLKSGDTYYVYFSGGDYDHPFQGFTFEPMPDPVDVTIGGTGFATFSCEYPLDFTGTDVKAYTASLDGDNTILLTKVGKVPAGTGLVLKGASESVPVAAGFVTAPATNLLVASTADNIAATDEANNSYNYVLANGSAGVGFYNLAGEKNIGVGKAYLHTTTALATGGSARAAWSFDDEETTGINTVNGEEVMTNGFYNLNGQRVAQPTKGLYIVNGKKVIKK